MELHTPLKGTSWKRPYLVRGARAGFSYGDGTFEDALNRDALMCAIDLCIIGEGTTAESLARLRVAFASNEIITAGSSSQLSDGGCALPTSTSSR